jgi:hypothetical protein
MSARAANEALIAYEVDFFDGSSQTPDRRHT